MGANISSVLNTAKLGLLAQQLAIEVTGNNIANVQTEGFTRQQVVFDVNRPRMTGLGLIGTGVRVAGIERIHDQFLFNQIVGEGDLLGNSQVRRDVFEQLEILFNETDGRSVNRELSNFFASLQDLASNPNGLAERASVIANAESLVSVFNTLGNQLFQIRTSLNQRVADETVAVNTLTAEIAKLNSAIHANEPGNLTANDLRDQRDRLIKELSEKIDITVLDEMNGQLSITLRDGTPLVLRNRSFDLSTGLNGNNSAFNDVFIDNGGGGLTNVTSTIQGGALRALLEMRDTVVVSIQDRLNRLVTGFVREFNSVHHQGIGLDGSTGVDFFTPLTPTVQTNTLNTGTGTVAAVNANPANASVDRYEILMTGASTFTLNNLTTGAASGTFSFTPGSAFNLAGGFAVTITGTPAAGDRFTFSASENAAARISVSSQVKAEPAKIAAGLSNANDGANALALADLQNSLAFNSVSLQAGSGTFTFDEFYNSIVGSVGIQSASAQAAVNQQEGVLLQLNNRRDSVSGVSIDEEMINMIKFQQAFNAAARLIVTVNEMFDVLQNRV